MPHVSTEMFDEALDRIISDNVDYVPPYGSGGAMYIRPFLFGHGAKMGLGPAPEYSFCIVASPVGAYYKGGLEAIEALVVEQYDRAAPRGVGNIKAAGNYAPDVQPSMDAKAQGFPVCLYLDAKTNSCVATPLASPAATARSPRNAAPPPCRTTGTQQQQQRRS